MDEIRAIVSGRVQGVMFRAFVHKHAQRLSLFGLVRNLSDGTVEVEAQGEEDALKKLIEYLHKGPLLSKVAGVDVEWREPIRTYGSFEIE